MIVLSHQRQVEFDWQMAKVIRYMHDYINFINELRTPEEALILVLYNDGI